MFKTIHFESSVRQEMINLKEQVEDFVAESGVEEGVCLVYCPHTTGGLVINSYLDPMTPKDIMHEIDRLIPTRLDFYHTFDTPSDAAGHVKSSLVGVNNLFVIHEGKLMLGHSQGILFTEFDGPRDRMVFVKIIQG
jgi:secondary thiamine-phosphate synthase enzyme